MPGPLPALLLVCLLLAGPLVALQARPGPVRVSGHSLGDDAGEFPALGASLFWAAWAYRHDRPRLDAALSLLSAHGVDYVRALGVVGRQPYWAGREIDWRWPDYDEVIGGVTDYAYERYGLRVQWTIFGDADQMIPDPADRKRLVDRFLAMSRGRERAIIHFEMANESWQNGFAGAEGIAELRALTRQLASRTAIPVAISDSEGHECEDHLALYRDMDVEIVTDHFARHVRGPAGSWGPTLEPWRLRECEGLPPVRSSNEPIGPRSSVASEEDPSRLVGAALAAYLSGTGLYVFHTDAGIWGREPLESMPNALETLRAFRAMKAYLPPDIVNWTHHRHRDAGHPFVAFADGMPDATWPDGHLDGAVEVFAGVRDGRFFGAAIGVINGLTLEAKRPVRLEVLHALTGETLSTHDVPAGGRVRLQAFPVQVLRGELAAP